MNRLAFSIAFVGCIAQSASAADGIAAVQSYGGAAWSPHLVGGLIGVLSMLTFYFSNKALGASTAYARIAGMVGEQVAPTHTQGLKYFRDNPPRLAGN